MIDIKTWGEFLFALWKAIKKHQTVKDWGAFIKEMESMMQQFPHPIFNTMILAFLEQKSMESIRGNASDEEIEQMNSVHFPLAK